MSHVGQKERGEDLRQRTNFEQRICGNGPCIARVLLAVNESPVGDHARRFRRHACRAFLDINAAAENVAYRVV
jgi:hypothetical protein